MGFVKHIKEEFQVIRERDPAIKTPLEVLSLIHIFCYTLRMAEICADKRRAG